MRARSAVRASLTRNDPLFLEGHSHLRATLGAHDRRELQDDVQHIDALRCPAFW
jgi:hypothetical protein